MPGLRLGNGDDALAVATDRTVVMSVDTLVEGTHVLPGTAPEDIAGKALRSALSDLVAMGADPWFYTLSLVVPGEYPDDWWERFSSALLAENHRWGCPCLGGDTTRGPLLVVTVQVHGLVDQPVTRAGMRPGDDVWLLGAVGDAAAGLSLLREGRWTQEQQPLIDAFFRPELYFAALTDLRPVMTSAIDVSDGLLADSRHLVESSGFGITLDVQKVPLSATLRATLNEAEARRLALSGGEDYALVFSAAAGDRATLQQLTRWPLARLGEVNDSGDLVVMDGGKRLTDLEEGYDHFRSGH